MSYRYRLNKYNRIFIAQLNNFPTVKKHKEWLATFFYNINDDENYIIEHMEQTELFDMGEPDCIKKILEKYKTPFTSQELIDEYNEYDFIVLDKEGLELIIEGYCEQIAQSYRTMFNNGNITKENQNEILFFLDRRANLWYNPEHPKWKPYNLKENMSMVSAGDYEYQIWELIKIYKDFDWDNYKLVLTGW